MDLTIIPTTLAGAIRPPDSKSQAHRVVLAMALSRGAGTLEHLSVSQDILATQDCIAALKTGRPCLEDGLPVLDCRESGSTLRFLIPLALALRGGGCFCGKGRLMERPQTPYFDLFAEKGIAWKREDSRLEIRGTLLPGIYRLPGNVSSQFVTGLLFALPLLKGSSEIQLTTPLESKGYVDITLDVLEKSGIQVENQGYKRFRIPGKQTYAARNLSVEPDWSQAAFWYAARALGSDITVEGMNLRSVQGDRIICEYDQRLRGPGEVVLDVSQCPDLVPPLAVQAALRAGETTVIGNAARLRLKESDRLVTVTQVLNTLGGQVEEHPDSLTIHGMDRLKGGVQVDCANDHRIAMMAAIAATRCREPVTLLGAECVQKSYPAFWEHYSRLGGVFRVLVHG